MREAATHRGSKPSTRAETTALQPKQAQAQILHMHSVSASSGFSFIFSSDKQRSQRGSREQKVYFYAKNGGCKAKRYIFSKEVYSPIVLIGIFCFNKWLQSCLSFSFCSSFIYPAVIIPAGNATIAIPKIAEIMVIIFPATDMV